MNRILFLHCSSIEITSRWVFTSLMPSVERAGYEFHSLNVKTVNEDLICQKIMELSRSDLIVGDLRDHHISKKLEEVLEFALPVKFNLLIDPDLTFTLSNRIAYKIFDQTLVAFLSTFNKYHKRYDKLIYFPYCAFIPTENDYSKIEKKRAVVFIGSPTENRLRYLALLKYWNVPIVSNIRVSMPKKYKLPKFNYNYFRRWDLYLFIRMSNLLSKLLSSKIPFSLIKFTDEEYLNIYSNNLVALSVLEYGRTGCILPVAYSHIRMRDLEAMATGCIVVTRETMDTTYLSKQGVYLFTYRDNRSLWNSISTSLKTENYHEKILKNQKILKEKFDWGKNLFKLHQLKQEEKKYNDES